MPKSKKMKLTLLDLDGCVYHHYSKGGKIGPVEEWIFATNRLLLEYEEKRINEHRFKKVVIAYGTNRQDYGCNLANIHRGGSLTPVLPLVQSYFDCCTFADVVLDPFMMADIFGREQSAGDSYEAILREEYRDSKDEDHSSWVFDSSKVSLIYAHAHRVASLNPKMKTILIDYYEDTHHIIESVNRFYSRYPQCLPEHVQLCIHQYNGKKLHQVSSIQGCGEVDHRYDWSVRYLSLMAGIFQGSQQAPQIPADHQELKNFHEENIYCDDDDQLKMMLSSEHFDVDAFLDFRSRYISALESNPNLTAKGYSNAINLFINGLIPVEFVFQNRLRPEVRDGYYEMAKAFHEESIKPTQEKKGCCRLPSFFKKKRVLPDDIALEVELQRMQNA